MRPWMSLLGRASRGKGRLRVLLRGDRTIEKFALQCAHPRLADRLVTRNACPRFSRSSLRLRPNFSMSRQECNRIKASFV